jgi:hypothetical protein
MGKYEKSYVSFFWLRIRTSEWIFLNGKECWRFKKDAEVFD